MRNFPILRSYRLAPVIIILLLSLLGVSAVFTLTNNDFEGQDGDLLSDGSVRDWVDLIPNVVVAPDKPSGSSDDSFKRGTDENDAEPFIDVGSIPKNKSDLIRFYVANEQLDTPTGAHDFLYLGWVRTSDSGSTNMDFEFNQLKQLSGNGVMPVREPGDILITFQLGGSNEVLLGMSRWDYPADGGACEAGAPPCWGPIQTLDDGSGIAEGAVNTTAVYDPIFANESPDPELDHTLDPMLFGEAAIDLTLAGVFNNTNDRVAFGSAYLKSRSSDSFTASMKDFIAPVPVSVNNCGSITVVKEADPFGEAQDFHFSTLLTSSDPNSATAGDALAFLAGFTLDNDPASSNIEDRETFLLFPGIYTITEDEVVTSGLSWDLSSLVCNPDSSVSYNPDLRQVEVNLALRENVTCTFTNQMRGNIEIITGSIPNDSENFSYSVAGGLVTASFDLDDDAGIAGEDITSFDIRELIDLPAGPYQVTQLLSDGWDLTAVTCIDPDGETTPDLSGLANIDLDPGETVTCTFENTKRGTIVVEKQTIGGNGTFNFSGDASGSISDGGQIIVRDLPANQSYAVVETPHPSFDLTGISCDDSDDFGTSSSGEIGTATATFALDPGETVTCTFTNTKRGTIIVEKQTIGCDGTETFQFTGDAAGTILAGVPIIVENLVANQSYRATESSDPAFDLSGIACVDSDVNGVPSSGDIGSRTATFRVDPGETVKCTFTNTKRSTIIVEKLTIGGDGNFTFTGDAAGTISHLGQIEVANLAPNAPYTSTESDPSPDFVLTDITCDDQASTDLSDVNTRTAVFHMLEPGETVKCTFTNTKRGTLTIIQESSPADPQNFEFSVLGEGFSSTFWLDDDSTLKNRDRRDLTDTQTFSGLEPGTFIVTQAAVMVPDPTNPSGDPVPGWDLTGLTCEATASGSGDTSFAYEGAAAEITLGPGSAVVCTFTNTKRGRIIMVPDPTNPSGDPVPGWDLTGLTCEATASGSGDTSFAYEGAAAEITLGPGSAVVCTFTNTKRGRIIIDKDTVPP